MAGYHSGDAARDRWFDLMLVVVSLLVVYLLIFLIIDPFSLPVRNPDLWLMVPLAENIANGSPQVSPFWNLGYPALLSVFTQFCGGYGTAETVLSLLTGGCFLLLSYFVGRKYLGRYWAIAVLWLTASSEVFIFCVGGFKDYLLLASLLISAILCLEWAVRKNRWWSVLIAGGVLGVGYLDRYIILLVLPVSLLWIIFKAEGRSRRVVLTIIYFAGFLILASPQIAVNLWREGNPFYSGNARTIWFALQGGHDWSLLFSHNKEESIFNLFFADPIKMIVMWSKNCVALLLIPLIQIPAFIFGWAGLIFVWFKRKEWHIGLPFAVLALYSAITLLFKFWSHYYIAVSSYMAVGALALMKEIIPRRICKGKGFPLITPLVVVFVIIGLAISIYSVKYDKLYQWEKEAIFEVSEKLSSQGVTDPEAVLSTNHNLYLVDAEVADKQFAMLPYDICSLEELTKYIRDNSYHYFIAYNVGGTEGSWQGLTAQLVETDKMPSNFKPIYSKTGAQTLIIYYIE